MEQKGVLIWITGLSGVGKSTVSRALKEILVRDYSNIVWLDGDTLRDVLGISAGYDWASRKHYAFIYSRLCELLVKQGMIVICSTISLFHDVQKRNREKNERYIEVFLEAPIEILQKRDNKKVYSTKMDKQIVGVDICPEYPQNPDLRFCTHSEISPEEIAYKIYSKFIKI